MNRSSVVRIFTSIVIPITVVVLLITMLSLSFIGILIVDARSGIQKTNVMRDFKGVNLRMTKEEVHKLLGKPATEESDIDEWKMIGDDTVTIRYDDSKVKAIQLEFLDPKNAPRLKDVVGDAEVSILDNGAKTARKVLNEENFWVSYYQNKDETRIRITIQVNKL